MNALFLIKRSLIFLMLVGIVSSAVGQKIDRTILPIHVPKVPPITEMDARNATAPPTFEVKAPEGAPNVVVILIDDIGFGATSTFG